MTGSGRLLVVGPAWVGDMVIAQTLFQLLRDGGATQIDVIAPGWSRDVLARMPETNTAIVLDVAHGELGLGKRYALGKQLRQAGYDRAIILPRSFKAALVPWFARVPERIGFAGELRSPLLTETRALDRATLDQTVKRFATLGLAPDAPLTDLPVPRLQIMADNQQQLAATHDLATDGDAVALMPGAAYGPAKMWPIDYFAELAENLTAQGRQVWVLGTGDERPLGDIIAARGGRLVRNLCGATRLADAVDILALATAAVSNDSGLMHIAAASGTYVVGIYGSTPPHYAPPLTAARTIHFLNLDCSPCRKRECPLGHLNCMRQIEPAAVLASIADARP